MTRREATWTWTWTWTWTLLACGSTPPAGAMPTAPEHCEIAGTADALALRVPGIDVPTLVATGVPAEVALDLSDGTEHVRGHVLAPIELRGEGALDELHLVLARGTTDLPVSLRAGAPVSRPAVRDGAIRALVVLEGSRQTPEVSLVLSLGCGDVALGDFANPPIEADDAARPTHELADTQDLPLSTAPGVEASAMLALADLDVRLQVTVVEERDGWSHVVRRLYWARIDGWVPSDRLRPSSDAEWRLASTGGWGSGSGCGRSEHPYAYRGPATVAAGTPVTDEHTGTSWGRFVAATEVEIGIRATDPTGMVEVIDAPGIASPECSNLEFDHALVPRDAVVLPTGP